MHWMGYILLFFLAYCGMEFMAWFTHKFVMHGFLWYLHEDHHVKDPEQKLERNDSFFIIFAIPGILCLFLGTILKMYFLVPIGIGITAYGFTYFLLHDVLIHQRLSFFTNTKNKYLKAVQRAHHQHHKHITKEDGECFGMLLFPNKFWKQKELLK